MALHLLWGVLVAALVLERMSPTQRADTLQAWSRKLLEILGLKWQIVGNLPEPAQFPLLLTSNHVSWVDIFALLALYPVRFVSKAEVRNWPVLGWLAARIGTLFINRDQRRQTRDIGSLMHEILQSGSSLGLFPEATTSHGQDVLPFKSALLQPAVQCARPLLPVAIKYRMEDGSVHPGIPFVGDMNFVQSLGRILGSPCSRVEVHIGQAESVEGRDRRALAQSLEAQTRQLLCAVEPEFRVRAGQST